MNPAAEAESLRYRQEIENLVELFLNGEITRGAFQKAYINATDRHQAAMYAIGGGLVDSSAGKRILDEKRQQTRKSVRNLAGDLLKASAELTVAAILERFSSRLTLWQNTGLGVFDAGVEDAPDIDGIPEIKLRWDFDPRKEHCRDCAALDGVVLTKSEWKQLGIRPRSSQLECGGWYCGCTRNETDEESHGLEAVKAKLGI